MYCLPPDSKPGSAPSRRKPGAHKVDAADWGDADNPLMGPHGPSFIGRVVRDPVSAKVKLVYDGHNRYDFHAVDLWTRQVVEGSVEKLKKDRYIFKPVPLLYRTWMYHESYRNHRSHATTSDDTGVIRQILSRECIDADIAAGRWSPLASQLVQVHEIGAFLRGLWFGMSQRSLSVWVRDYRPASSDRHPNWPLCDS